MKKIALTLAVLSLFPNSGQTITWDFDIDADTQGWSAWDIYARAIPLVSEVSGGVWRITPISFVEKQDRLIYLTSPVINQNSALFDRVTVRFRVVHTRPFLSGMALAWNNSDLVSSIGTPPLVGATAWGFFEGLPLTFTTEWQEATFSALVDGRLINYGKDHVVPLVWGKTLNRISLTVSALEPVKSPLLPTVENLIESLEIDKITLTGVEEQLGGELPPPQIANLGKPGELFSEAQFSPMGRSRVEGWLIKNTPLVDIDGDNDLDLALTWRQHEAGAGVFSLTNDGQGNFGRGALEFTADIGPGVVGLVGTGDLNEDGRGDVVLLLNGLELGLELLLSDPKGEGLYEHRTLERNLVAGIFSGLGVADYDDDGDPDIWLSTFPWGKPAKLLVLLNEGDGEFHRKVEIPAPNLYAPRFVCDLDQDGRMDVVWVPAGLPPGDTVDDSNTGKGEANTAAILVSASIGSAGLEQTYSLQLDGQTDFDGWLVQAIGDFTADGDVDILLPIDGVHLSTQRPSVGLRLAENEGTNRLRIHTLYDEATVSYCTEHGISVADLNGDGILDLVVANRTLQSRGVLVLIGKENETPQYEGYYPLEGEGDQAWPGDLDSDGDMDLVAPDIGYQDGGIHVLFNQSVQTTAIEEGTTAYPTYSHLSPAYPNPFNPGIVIPFTIGSSAGRVSLNIYNTLGQEVRSLELGEMSVGEQHVFWDGMGNDRQDLPAGVYIFRLQTQPQTFTGKLVRIR